MRKSDWASLIVAGILIVGAFFVLFVPIDTAKEVTRGEVLQAFANLVGAAIGTLGAYLVAQWTMGKSERDRKLHQAELADATYNAIRAYIEYMDEIRPEIENLGAGANSVHSFCRFEWRHNKNWRPVSAPLRAQLAAAFPYIENEIDEIDHWFQEWKKQLEAARIYTDQSYANDHHLKPISLAIDALANVADARVKIMERFEHAKKIVNETSEWTNDVTDAKAFEESVKALRSRVPVVE
jgi:hypothetical protein